MTIYSSLGAGPSMYVCAVLLAGAAAGCSSDGTPVLPTTPGMATINLPTAMGGIRFYDSLYSVKLRKLCVPGAATGKLFLIDPDTLGVSIIDGFAWPDAAPPDAGGSGPPRGGIATITEGSLRVTRMDDMNQS